MVQKLFSSNVWVKPNERKLRSRWPGMERHSWLMIFHFISSAALLVILGGYLIILGASFIICGICTITSGAYGILLGAHVLIFGAFVFIFGAFVFIFGAFVFIFGAMSLYSVLFLHPMPLSLYSVVSALHAVLWTRYLHGASFSWRRRSGYGSRPSWLVHSDSFKTWNQFWMNWASLGTIAVRFEVETIDPDVVESLTNDN